MKRIISAALGATIATALVEFILSAPLLGASLVVAVALVAFPLFFVAFYTSPPQP